MFWPPRAGLSLMNTSVCDHHFFPRECNDDVISRALLWVCEHQTHDPSSPVNCPGEGINLVPCNIEKRFVGRQQECAGRQTPGPPWRLWLRAARILIAASSEAVFWNAFAGPSLPPGAVAGRRGGGDAERWVFSSLICSAIMR